LTFTVQPREIRAFLAVMPAPVGAALVPNEKTLLSSSVPFDVPFDSIDIRILLTEVAVRAQSLKAIVKFVQGQPLNTPAGKSAKAVHSPHAFTNVVALLVTINGNELRLVQPRQVELKPVPLLILINGNELRLLQFCQVELKLVLLLVLINGNEVRLVQFRQVWLKSVPLLVSINSNEVRLLQFHQVDSKLVPLLVSINGNELRLLQLCQAD